MKFLTFFIPILLMLASSNGQATTDIRAGKIVYAKGKVTVHRRGGKNMEANKGLNLKIGDSVLTGKSGIAIVKLKDDSTIKLNKSSKIIINEVAGVKEKKSTTLYFQVGSIFAKIAKGKKKKPKFMIKTKSVSMGVRGTEFFAAYGDQKTRDDVWMCVNTGTVRVHTHNKMNSGQTVKAGEGVKAENKNKGRVSKPEKLPWTKNLNWNFDPEGGEVENKVDIKDAYANPLDVDYD